jgi:XTP/dITP diphosphohydrolase
MKITYVTSRSSKVKSLQRMLPASVELIQLGLDLPEPRLLDVKEIAVKKAIYAYNKLKEPIVVLDAGFFIHSLKGYPATFVNFPLDTIGIEGILRLVEGKDRTCEFRECLAYLDASFNEPKCFVATIPGVLSKWPKGKRKAYHWSDLCRIFIPLGESKTLAEMKGAEYMYWSKNIKKESVEKMFAEWITDKS